MQREPVQPADPRTPHAQAHTHPPPANGKTRARGTYADAPRCSRPPAALRGSGPTRPSRGAAPATATAAAATMANGHGRRRALVATLGGPRRRGGLPLHPEAAHAVARLASAFLCYWLCAIVGVFVSHANTAL
jgi:hypothetical protein